MPDNPTVLQGTLYKIEVVAESPQRGFFLRLTHYPHWGYYPSAESENQLRSALAERLPADRWTFCGGGSWQSSDISSSVREGLVSILREAGMVPLEESPLFQGLERDENPLGPGSQRNQSATRRPISVSEEPRQGGGRGPHGDIHRAVETARGVASSLSLPESVRWGYFFPDFLTSSGLGSITTITIFIGRLQNTSGEPHFREPGSFGDSLRTLARDLGTVEVVDTTLGCYRVLLQPGRDLARSRALLQSRLEGIGCIQLQNRTTFSPVVEDSPNPQMEVSSQEMSDLRSVLTDGICDEISRDDRLVPGGPDLRIFYTYPEFRASLENGSPSPSPARGVVRFRCGRRRVDGVILGEEDPHLFDFLDEVFQDYDLDHPTSNIYAIASVDAAEANQVIEVITRRLRDQGAELTTSSTQGT